MDPGQRVPLPLPPDEADDAGVGVAGEEPHELRADVPGRPDDRHLDRIAVERAQTVRGRRAGRGAWSREDGPPRSPRPPSPRSPARPTAHRRQARGLGERAARHLLMTIQGRCIVMQHACEHAAARLLAIRRALAGTVCMTSGRGAAGMGGCGLRSAIVARCSASDARRRAGERVVVASSPRARRSSSAGPRRPERPSRSPAVDADRCRRPRGSAWTTRKASSTPTDAHDDGRVIGRDRGGPPVCGEDDLAGVHPGRGDVVQERTMAGGSPVDQRDDRPHLRGTPPEPDLHEGSRASTSPASRSARSRSRRWPRPAGRGRRSPRTSSHDQGQRCEAARGTGAPTSSTSGRARGSPPAPRRPRARWPAGARSANRSSATSRPSRTVMCIGAPVRSPPCLQPGRDLQTRLLRGVRDLEDIPLGAR